MPRYFFHIHDDKDFQDNEGTILPDAAAARAEAIATAGELLKEKGEAFWGGSEWHMIVIDEAGQVVCELRFSAK